MTFLIIRLSAHAYILNIFSAYFVVAILRNLTESNLAVVSTLAAM